MAFGGALSFNGWDGTIAAGINNLIPALVVPPTVFYAIPAGGTCADATFPDVSFTFNFPLIDSALNVTVNGFSMTAEFDAFGTFNIFGDVTLSNESCNPVSGFEVPNAATIGNVLVNNIRAAIPDVPAPIAPIVDDAQMAMRTAQTNVILYW